MVCAREAAPRATFWWVCVDAAALRAFFNARAFAPAPRLHCSNKVLRWSWICLSPLHATADARTLGGHEPDIDGHEPDIDGQEAIHRGLDGAGA